VSGAIGVRRRRARTSASDRGGPISPPATNRGRGRRPQFKSTPANDRYRRKGVIGRAASEGPLFDGERPFVVAVVGFRSCSLFGHSLIVAGLSQLGGEPTFRLRGGAGSRLPGADQAVAGGVRRQRLCDSVSGLGWGFPSRSVCGMAHQPAQFLAPAVQPRADGAERDIKNLSDRAVAQAVQTD
jgi:hypothetical protein